MVRGMDEAGLLNSMTQEQLFVTCNRLQRSCKDMEMLLAELEEEQAFLRREQDKLQNRLEKMSSQVESGKKDKGIIWNLIEDASTRLELSHIFRAKEERKAAKRRRCWSHPVEPTPVMQNEEAAGAVESGPFSDASLQMSWGQDLILGVVRQSASKGPDMAELEEWVRTMVSGEPVAEAEPLPDSAEMWARQFAGSLGGPSPTASPQFTGAEQQVGFGGELAMTRARTLPNCESSPPKSSPPASARRFSEAGLPSSRGQALPADVAPENDPNSSPGASGMEDASFEPSPTAAGEPGLETLVGSALGIEKKTTSRKTDGPAPPSFSRRMTEFTGGAIQWVAELATGSGNTAADSSTSRSDGKAAGEMFATTSLTVVLQRQSDKQLWGLAWMKDGFTQRGERVVEKTMKGSVAESWNKQQEQAGHPERCIRPLDRLVSVNGKMGKEEIKGELASHEVVLEFHRLVPQKDTPAAVPKASGAAPAAAAPVEAKSLAEPAAKRGKATFGDAFSAYLEAVGPPQSEGPAGRAGEAFLEEREEPSRLAKVEEAPEPAWEEVAPEEAVEKVPCEGPYGLVVQILSLGAGSVRLSWSFRWENAPASLAEEAWAKGFQVFWRTGSEPELERKFSDRPQLTLTLPPGQLYTLHVCAVLQDVDESELWISEASQEACADLRGPVGLAAQQAAVAPAVPEKASPPRPRTRVAAGLGSFLEQGLMAPSTERRAVSSSTVASPVKAPPEREPSIQSEVTSPEVERAPVVMGPVDPLTTSKPLMVVAKPRDPAAEKRDIAERLRLRHGGARLPVQETQGLDRMRSESMDSDEECSLMRISAALRSLEKTAAQSGRDSVAQEGHHSLQHRLDGGQDEPVHPGSPHRPAASSSAGDPASSAGRGGKGEAAAAASVGPGPRPLPASFPPGSPAPGHAHSIPPSPSTRAASEASPSRVAGLSPNSPPAVQPAPAAPVFMLALQISDDKIANIEFRSGDDLPQLVEDFLTKNKVKDLFKGPLLRHAEKMLASGKQEDSVDIVDLLD